MKVKVDQNACIGCRQCVEICPEVFRMNDEERAEVYAEVTPVLQDTTVEAAASCPVAAIEIEY